MSFRNWPGVLAMQAVLDAADAFDANETQQKPYNKIQLQRAQQLMETTWRRIVKYRGFEPGEPGYIINDRTAKVWKLESEPRYGDRWRVLVISIFTIFRGSFYKNMRLRCIAAILICNLESEYRRRQQGLPDWNADQRRTFFERALSIAETRETIDSINNPDRAVLAPSILPTTHLRSNIRKLGYFP